MKKFKIIPVVTIVLAITSLTACSNDLSSKQASVTDFKLDTYISIDAYDSSTENILNKAVELCDYYENIFSMHSPDSALWKLNNNKTDVVPHELGELINYSLSMGKISDGKFAISIGSVSSLWSFNGTNDNIPESAAISEGLKHINDNLISASPLDENNPDSDWRITKPKDTVIDLGAVAKGYIADKLKEYLMENEVLSAVINLGGNVLCVGDKNGVPFNIGIRSPFNDNADPLTILELDDISAITSGISERYFKDKDGKIMHHILDPSTGYPIQNGLYQVTIISKNSTQGDSLSTIAFSLGLEKGMDLIENTPDTEAIFVTDDGNMHFSSGADNYTKK